MTNKLAELERQLVESIDNEKTTSRFYEQLYAQPLLEIADQIPKEVDDGLGGFSHGPAMQWLCSLPKRLAELERQLVERDADLKHCEDLCSEACRLLCQFRPAEAGQINSRIRRVANGHCPPVPMETASTTVETISTEKFAEYVARCNSGDVKSLNPLRPPYRPFQKKSKSQ